MTVPIVPDAVPDEAPMAAAARALRAYLDAHAPLGDAQAPLGYVRDPWDRVLDGVLVRVHEKRWPGLVKLEADDFGLDRADYAALAPRMRWGHLDLLPERLGNQIEAAVSRARRLPKLLGVAVHWGQYVPLRAMGRFQEAWSAIVADFDAAIAQWVEHYAIHVQAARQTCATFAQRSAQVAATLGLNVAPDFEERLVARLMATYPERAVLRDHFRLWYETAFIPTPRLLQEQAAFLEREAEEQRHQLALLREEHWRLEQEAQLENLARAARLTEAQRAAEIREAAMRAEAERIRNDLRMRANALLAQFEQTYAADMRRRLRDALAALIAAVQHGRSRASAVRAVTEVIRDLRLMAAPEDVELHVLMERVEHAVAARRASRRAAPSDAEVQHVIADVHALLDASLIMLGDARPRRADTDQPDRPVSETDDLLAPAEVRARVGRLGLAEKDSLTLALALADAPRRTRAMGERL